MLKLSHPSQSASSARLPQATQLGLSWLNGRLTAVALHHGAVGTAWTCPTPVNSVAEFAVALREAVRRTAFEGTSAAMVLLHPQFMHQWVEIPSGKAGPLTKYLQRQVEQNKPFAGKASWAFQITAPDKAGGGALLHLMPAELCEGIMAACSEAGLHLVLLTAGAEVLRAQLRHFSLGAEETVLVAAAVGEVTTALVARGDGTPLLVRTIPGGWQAEPGRVAVELNRTLLYAQQHFGVALTGVYLGGAGAEDQVPVLNGFFEVPLQPSPAASGETTWAEEALRLVAETPVNLVTREHREAPARRTAMRFGSYAVAALCLVSVAFSGYVNYHRRLEVRGIALLEVMERGLQAKHHQLQEHFVETERKRVFLEVANADRTDPVATWVLGTVTESLPAELLLNELVLLAETNQFRVTISGSLQPAAEEAGTAEIRGLTRQLARKLSEGPLGLQFADDLLAAANGPARVKSTNGVAAARDQGGLQAAAFNSWSGRLRELTAAPTAKSRDFLIQGVMR